MNKNTFIHKLDPRTKICLLFITFILALLYHHPVYPLFLLILVLLQGIVSKTLSNLKLIWRLLLLLAILTILIWSLSAKGESLIFWRVSYQSFLYGISSALKIDLMIIAGMVFLSTTRNEEIALGLIKLGIPYRVGFAFSTALRLIPTFIGTGATVIQAQRSRGLDPNEGNIIERIRKFIPLLVPIFLSTIRSTNLLSQALESRGFGLKRERTYYLTTEFTAGDFLITFICISFLVTSIVLKFMGFGEINGLNF